VDKKIYTEGNLKKIGGRAGGLGEVFLLRKLGGRGNVGSAGKEPTGRSSRLGYSHQGSGLRKRIKKVRGWGGQVSFHHSMLKRGGGTCIKNRGKGKLIKLLESVGPAVSKT